MKLKIYQLLCLLLCFSVISLNNLLAQQKLIQNAKPNIIFILTDDQRWDALGAMGNPIAKTPNIDDLAHKGTLFRNAFVTTSMCVVSRASILLGQYESRHKINSFITPFTAQQLQNTYPALLKKEANYKIGFIGKFGVGQPPYTEQSKGYDFFAVDNKGQPDYELKDENGNFIHHTDKVARDIDRFLDKFSNQGPFMLNVSFKAPHEQDKDPRQYIVQERFKDIYKDVHIPVPETADPKYWQSFPAFFKDSLNEARLRWWGRYSTPELFQENVKKYYSLITGVDEVVGKIRKKLKEKGIDKNTIIIFMGDNGFFLGEHGMTEKYYGQEESIRVPLIIYNPLAAAQYKGIQPPMIALNIDICPTILSFAGVPIPAQVQGVDLSQLLAHKIADRKDFFYEQTVFKTPKIPQVEGVVSTQLKYMNYIEHGYEQLFDLSKDPHERINYAGDTAYKKQLDSMRNRYKVLKELVR